MRQGEGMVDFSKSLELEQIAETVRTFALNEIYPRIDEIDEKQIFPVDILRRLGELGFMGVIFPEKYGGADFDYKAYATTIIELARIEPSVALSVAAHTSLCSNHIFTFGNEEQKNRWLPDLASGRKIGAWALTEPGSGSDAASMKTLAAKVDGGWLINGSKVFITHGYSGDIYVVMAVTDPGGRKGRNISAFVIEKGTEGLKAGKKENKLGVRASETTEIILENCFVPDDNVLGEVNTGFKQAMTILDGGRISIASLGVGIAKGAFDISIKYAKEREQFGKPIASFQAIQFTLAEMATRIAAAEALTFAAAAKKDKGEPITLLASEAKLYAGETAVFCSERAVQIHGGYGFIKDYKAEKFYRDAKICTIGEGTSEIQRLVIAKRLFNQ